MHGNGLFAGNRANRITGSRQRLQRSLSRASVGIVTIRRNMDFSRR